MQQHLIRWNVPLTGGSLDPKPTMMSLTITDDSVVAVLGLGTLESDVTVFSFYANKTITTGEGGMLVTRDPEVARRARVMRLHGINRDAFVQSTDPSTK